MVPDPVSKVAQQAAFWLDGLRRGLEKPELTLFLDTIFRLTRLLMYAIMYI